MSKFTARQKKNIVSAYAAGGVFYAIKHADQNGCLTGFNCRHTLGDYVPGVKPDTIPTDVIERRRSIEQKQREYEREIRKYKKASTVIQGVNPKQAKLF